MSGNHRGRPPADRRAQMTGPLVPDGGLAGAAPLSAPRRTGPTVTCDALPQACALKAVQRDLGTQVGTHHTRQAFTTLPHPYACSPSETLPASASGSACHAPSTGATCGRGRRRGPAHRTIGDAQLSAWGRSYRRPGSWRTKSHGVPLEVASPARLIAHLLHPADEHQGRGAGVDLAPYSPALPAYAQHSSEHPPSPLARAPAVAGARESSSVSRRLGGPGSDGIGLRRCRAHHIGKNCSGTFGCRSTTSCRTSSFAWRSTNKRRPSRTYRRRGVYHIDALT